jgi:chitin deacetylase
MLKRLLAIGLSLLGLLAGAAVLWQTGKSRSFQFFGVIVPRVETSQKVVALTFDDGPTPDKTDEILRILREENVKATFFVTGAELAQYPEGGRKIFADGHELGNHAYNHDRMILVTPGYVRQQIEDTDKLIRDAGYTGEITFRPPFGKKLFALPRYLQQHNRKTITWDIEPDSFPEVAATSDGIVRYVTERARPGSIILLHVMYPSRKTSLEAVRGIIAKLRQEGYKFLTVNELLATGSN